MTIDTTRESPSSPSPNKNDEDQQQLLSKSTSTSSTSTATDGAVSVNSRGQGAAVRPATVGATRKNEKKRSTRLGMLMKEHNVLLNSLSPFPVPILNTPAACSTVTPPGSTRLPHNVKRDQYQPLHEPDLLTIKQRRGSTPLC